MSFHAHNSMHYFLTTIRSHLEHHNRGRYGIEKQNEKLETTGVKAQSKEKKSSVDNETREYGGAGSPQQLKGRAQ